MKIESPLVALAVNNNAPATPLPSTEGQVRAMPTVATPPEEVKQLAAGPASPAKQATAQELRQAVDELQRKAQSVAPSLQFSIDQDSGRTVVKITDANTQELIRQIPAEEVLHLNKEIDRMQGLLFHKQA